MRGIHLRGAVIAAALGSILLAGCLIGPSPAPTVHVPFPSRDASYLYDVNHTEDTSDRNVSITTVGIRYAVTGETAARFSDGRNYPVISIERDRIERWRIGSETCRITHHERATLDPALRVWRSAPDRSNLTAESACSGGGADATSVSHLGLLPSQGVVSNTRETARTDLLPVIGGLFGRDLQAGDRFDVTRPVGPREAWPATWSLNYEVTNATESESGRRVDVIVRHAEGWNEGSEPWRLTFRDGTAFPTRWTAALPFQKPRLHATLDEHDTGGGALDWDGGAPSSSASSPTIPENGSPFEETPPTGSPDLAYPMDDAVASVEDDLTLTQHHVWMERHPDAVLAAAWLAPVDNGSGGGHRWILVWQDGGDVSGVLSHRDAEGSTENGVLGDGEARRAGGLPGRLDPTEARELRLTSLERAAAAYRNWTGRTGSLDYVTWLAFDTGARARGSGVENAWPTRVTACWTVGTASLRADGAVPGHALGFSAVDGYVTAEVHEPPSSPSGPRDIGVDACEGWEFRKRWTEDGALPV